jgi:GT2 family glycosyltransferase
MDDILAAVETINGDYEKNCRAAQEIARDYFNYDIVLGKMLRDLGITPRVPPPRPVHTFPSRLPLTPLSRRPIRLPEVTTRTVLGRHVPTFVPHDDPATARTSIIVATHNNLVFTRMSLESVLADTDYKNFEIVVVDNASTDGTPDYLRTLAAQNPQVRVIFNTENHGFAKANNQGLAAATGKFLVLLNNDTIVPPGWLGRLLRHLDDAAAGLVGPVTNRIGNASEIPAGYETYGEFLEFAASRAAAHAGASREIRMPAMFCLAMRRDTFEKIGPLDEQFEVGLFEDDDYAMRARNAGLRITCADDVFIHHFGEASLGELYPSGKHSDIFTANRARFEKKWGVEWSGHVCREKTEYRDLTARIHAAVLASTPRDAQIIVVSKGDPSLVDIPGRRTSHFPQDNAGNFRGFYPADSTEAIALIEASRSKGAEFLLFPATSRWWLDHYSEMRTHLDKTAITHEYGSCVIFDLYGRIGVRD